ncbi:MAG: hypothetical protein U5Q03_11800 [Bacteroidota bacterium]|nr:hypothetical protein [Bacteroidota bacterium]
MVAHDLEKGSRQQTTIRENPAASAGFDLEYDSYFISGYAPLFYSVSNGSAFALNTLPSLDENTQIPLSFIKNEASAYQIEMANAPYETDIFLTDLKENITVNLWGRSRL